MEGQLIPTSPTGEAATFRIGGEEINVPPLTLYHLDKAHDALVALDGRLDWISYGKQILDVVSVALEDAVPRERFTAEAMRKRCTVKEVRALTPSMNELLRISGFDMPGEEQAAGGAIPGIGTSTSSSPNSPSEESVAEIPAGSSAA